MLTTSELKIIEVAVDNGAKDFDDVKDYALSKMENTASLLRHETLDFARDVIYEDIYRSKTLT